MLPLGGGSDGQSPILVQRGTSLNLNIHALHRDRRAWGDDAESFNPERWEQGRPGWDYLPFSGGPRICPAQQRVFTEAAFILVRFAQRFSSIESRDQEPWTERLRMTVENRNGVKVGLTWAAGAGN